MSTGYPLLSLAGDERENVFKPAEYPSLSDSVLAEIRKAIINGKMPPGERLVEADLAEQFQVSRATIRQALAHLKIEGLVDVRPRRGCVVTRMSDDAARDVCTVRGILEGWAARVACLELSTADIARMRAMSSLMGESVQKGNVYEVMETDIELHSLICRCDPNAFLWERWQSLNTLHGALLVSRLAYYNYDPVGIVQRHNDLVDVLARRDPDAAEGAVRSHYISPFTDAHVGDDSRLLVRAPG